LLLSLRPDFRITPDLWTIGAVLTLAGNAWAKTPPDADQLRDILAHRFFGQPMKTRDVMAVAEMAIASSGGYGLLFNEVRQAFEGFQPSKAHKLVSAFNWRAIATTNYDRLVEKAYSDSPQRLQTLVPFVKDDQPIEEKLQAAILPCPIPQITWVLGPHT
jgi:hypothetical protein